MNKLFRSLTDRKLTGLCGGIAEWSGVNSTVIRLLVVAAGLCSFGTVALLYFISSILVPKMSYNRYL
ncbi:hypothetical protein A8709_31175 [Paenibacillus pectinilyticus]|uniref:Phage shock protein PspC N-terminal domain-containing protein n=1 Tax=Paenibacillus pectinilyticus TaxID=512399 RepID=A0A1C0ZW48_9BACL|nr:PspC domain-containing protein [Paenibacillus pectinilyticus]OCT12297.1 hypothetical protein A8709_31175 [Paenibacillus pectinilyticus]